MEELKKQTVESEATQTMAKGRDVLPESTGRGHQEEARTRGHCGPARARESMQMMMDTSKGVWEESHPLAALRLLPMPHWVYLA